MTARRIWAGLLTLAAATAGAAPAPIPVFDDAGALSRACDDALTQAREAAAAIRTVPLDEAGVTEILGAWDRMNIGMEDGVGPAYLQTYVHPDAEIRAAGEACILEYQQLETELFQDPDLHARVAAVTDGDAVDRKLREDLLESFADTGASLPPKPRKRAKDLLARIEALGQRFQRNLRENDATLVFSAEELSGLPPGYIERVGRRPDGGIEVGFDYPAYFPFMAHAESAAARERYYRAFANRGGEDNIAILHELTMLRAELATLYGLPDYAHLVTRRRMVGDPATVHEFLRQVDTVITPLTRQRLALLAALKARHLGRDEATIRPWDKRFYLERLRQRRYDINQETLRRHFPMPEMTAWVLDIAANLYGLRFTAVDRPTWHESVRYFEVRDAADDRLLGGLYLDLYPRPGKYGHAAAFPLRSASTHAARLPVSALVTNFDTTGLTFQEVETFLHEIGHALHNILSETRYSLHSGTQVALDFVEAPSQMFEAWARQPATLARIAAVCGDCPAIDRDLVARLQAARRLDRPLVYSRQLLYARYDLALASADPPDPVAAWAALAHARPLGHVGGTRFPGTFSHIAGGYAAGYYGYMWSESLALDMLTVWDDDLMDPSVGRRFRSRVLARGGEAPAAELVRGFLGREPRPDAFLAEIRGAGR